MQQFYHQDTQDFVGATPNGIANMQSVCDKYRSIRI